VFTKPTAISDALCTFLGVPKGTQLSRSDVTTRVCRYAKENSLMVKQVIKADAPMRKLLALTEKDELKILNLQRYLKPHYIKPPTTA
jgi:chromatin remodeling complex protein RSC6